MGKTIVRVQKNRTSYVMLDKTAARDPRLSLDELALHTKLMCKPDDWKIIFRALAVECRCSERTIRRLFKGLEKAGYCERWAVRDLRSGKFARWEFRVYETPREQKAPEPTLFEAHEKPHLQRNTPVAKNHPSGEPPSGEPLSGEVPTTELTTNRLKELTETTDDRIDGASTGVGVSSRSTYPRLVTDAPATSSSDQLEDSFVVENPHCDPVLLLVAAGFKPDDAAKQIARSGADAERVRLVLAHAARRSPSRHNGFVVKALREHWELDPVVDSAQRKHLTKKVEVIVHQISDERRQQGQKAMEDALASLTDAEWESHFQALLPGMRQKHRDEITAGKGRTNALIRAAVFLRMSEASKRRLESVS